MILIWSIIRRWPNQVYEGYTHMLENKPTENFKEKIRPSHSIHFILLFLIWHVDHALPICIHVKDWICRLGYAIVCTWGLLLRHVDGPLDFDPIIPLKKSTINFQYPCGPSSPSTHKISQWTTFQGIYNLHCLPLKYWEMITKHDLIQNC